jgi:bifunctional non-homologous end joining protein LigD
MTKRSPIAVEKTARTKPRSRARIPTFRPVQLATLVDHVPAGDRWLHEMKYDGYRGLIAIGGGQARVYTRSGLDWSDRFAGVIAAALNLKVDTALIDGEAVVLDDEGKSSFQALQAALKGGRADVVFYAFDLLELDGKELTGLPQIERKDRLASLVGDKGTIRYSEHIQGGGEKMLRAFCDAGLEGVVSKQADARYLGARSKAWLKTKCIRRQEFVVVGWTASDKARGFRSLLLGVNEDGKLRYAGKVGTGFDTAEMNRLKKRMEPLERKHPTVDAPRAAVRGAHWIEPRLGAEIAFTEVTSDGVLRHPSYLGLREDKKPEAVVFEKAVPIEAVATTASSTVTISNRARVLFPESGLSKGDLADYYLIIAEVMMPWVAERPISLIRCPQGRAKKCFFQKHDAGSFGDKVKHVAIREKNGSSEPYLYIEDADGLLTCVQMGTIEFHGWGARIEDVEKADRLVFDLDPDEGLGFDRVVRAAFEFRELLTKIGLVTFPMVTGGKGVHVVTPLTPQAELPAVKDFAHRFAQTVAATHPDRFTAVLSKAKRNGRIFVDYLRNQRGATAVMLYSVRARSGAPVAVPLTWEELRGLDSPAHWSARDGRALAKRADTKALPAGAGPIKCCLGLRKERAGEDRHIQRQRR